MKNRAHTYGRRGFLAYGISSRNDLQLQSLDAPSRPIELGDHQRMLVRNQRLGSAGMHPLQHTVHVDDPDEHRVGAVGVEVGEC